MDTREHYRLYKWSNEDQNWTYHHLYLQHNDAIYAYDQLVLNGRRCKLVKITESVVAQYGGEGL